jgi:hypothetical protein
MSNKQSFDRLRKRNAWAETTDEVTTRRSDPAGKQALYSANRVQRDQVRTGAGPRLEISCSKCGVASAVDPLSAIGLLIPSLHLPVIKRGAASWMKCPACRDRTWVSLSVHI